MDTQPEAPGTAADDHRARTRAAHAAAAAAAQAAAAARAREQAASRGLVIGPDAERAGRYAGLVTRAIAYTIDLVIINLVSLVVGIAVALAAAVLPTISDSLDTAVAALLAVATLLWVVAYFVSFWATTGQTPGARVMRIRVIDAHGAPRISVRRALVRFAGIVLATIPLFAGFLIMLWDDRRRCLQDRLARTTVVHAPPQPRIVRQRIPREPG
jgi:uncharacterized RDD family membrane protein YckC